MTRALPLVLALVALALVLSGVLAPPVAPPVAAEAPVKVEALVLAEGATLSVLAPGDGDVLFLFIDSGEGSQ